jgi:cbb3-type cytochrome oxidase maturation protein
VKVILFQPLNPETMSALFLLIGISLLLAAIFLAAFLWSVQKGQYHNTQSPSVPMSLHGERVHLKSKTNGTRNSFKKA